MASVLLMLGFVRLTGRVAASAFVAAVFAVHPLHVESVAWAIERKDVLSGFFFAALLWLYARYVELPEPGTEVGQDDVLGTIESVKAVSEIFSPVSGTVTEVNQALDEKPEAVNQEPHGAGWYCKMRLSDPSQLEGLMDAEAYAELAQAG